VFRKAIYLVLTLLVSAFGVARGQQAVSSITQSRLFTNPSAPGTTSVDANGTALPDEEEEEGPSTDDDSFGAQIILKNQQRRRSFSVFADVSAFHTNNVDLTPSGTRSDSFLAANIGAAWRPALSQELLAEVLVGSSLFRYDRARELDFQKLFAGAGLSWAVPRTPGIIAFGRYDFIEVLDSGNNELLQDHEFSIGAQKIFVFGRSHFLTTGLTGTVGLTTPQSQERDQAAIYSAYHLKITRSFEADLLYRYAAQFYATGDRMDHNQTLSLALSFVPNRWLRVAGSISAARNDSNRSPFDYDVLNFGGGLRLEVTF
jgi:hypothetical protein